MRQDGVSSARVLAVWGLTAALLAVALVAGRLAADVVSEQWLGMLAAFAAGAVLASLADSVMPEAYAEGGPLVAFATSAGFLAAYALTSSTDEREACRATADLTRRGRAGSERRPRRAPLALAGRFA